MNSSSVSTKSRSLYDTANAILKKANTSNPAELARIFNVKLILKNGFESFYGCYSQFTETHKFIVVNSELDKHVQDFVILHELAHSILHSKDAMTAIDDESNLRKPTPEKRIQEHEANILATHLFISDEDFIEKVYKSDTPYVLPLDVAEIKYAELKKLGIIE